MSSKKKKGKKKSGGLSSKKALQDKQKEINFCKNSQEILEAFSSADSDFDFTINFDEFTDALDKLGADDIDFNACKKAYKLLEIQEDGDGIELEEFVYGVHMCAPDISTKLMWKPVYFSKGKWKQPPYVEDFLGFDEAISMIQDTNEEFSRQTMALRSIIDVVCSPDVSDVEGTKYAKKLVNSTKQDKNPLIKAGLKSKKPMIVIETLFTIAAMAKCRKRAITQLSPKLLKYCWEALDSDEFGLANASINCMKAITKWVPDDGNKSQLKMLLQGSGMETFPNIINASFQCLKIRIKNESNPKIKGDKDFFVKVKDIIKEKIDKSKDQRIRDMGFDLLQSLETHNPKQAIRVTSGFDRDMENDYKRFKGEEVIEETKDDENKGNNDEWETNDDDYQGYRPKDSKDLLRERNFTVRNFKDYKKDLQDMFDEFDIYDNDEIRGSISAERATQYLRLIDVTGMQATMAIKALDVKFDGNIKKNLLVNYGLRKNTKCRKNEFLERKAKDFGWIKSRESRLNERKEIYERLFEIEKKEFNYAGQNENDLKLDVIKYLLNKL